MRKILFFAFSVLLIGYSINNSVVYGQKQDKQSKVNNDSINPPDFKIMFYNCENYFDTFHDSLKRDQEFLPQGKKYWTWKKYIEKQNHIGKVIIAVGGWQPPDLVGLCEIENQNVLEGLVKYSPIKKFGYKIIHKESPDRRGIDVGLLYLPNKFRPLVEKFFEVKFPFAPKSKTRDVLYVKGIIGRIDTIHVFINHWPSRWGGQKETEPKRMFVAKLVRSKADSILKVNPLSNIVIMGDFNDYPDDKSLLEGMRASHDFSQIKPTEIYSLSYLLMLQGQGSHKYHGEWEILDQIMVSGSLLEKKNKIYCTTSDAHIFRKDFLLEKDEKHTGMMPYRTYIGYRYNGGFSDHLPVYLGLHKN